MARHRSPRSRRAHPPVAAGAPRTHRARPRPGGALAFTGGVLALGAAPVALSAVPAALVDHVSLEAMTSALVVPAAVAPADAAVRGTLEPVALAGAAGPETFAADLVKAVQRQEQQVREQAAATEQAAQKAAAEKAAAERAAQERARADCGIDTSGLGAVKAHVRAAAKFLGCRFGEPTMFGVAGRGGASDHPGGRAVDFMVDRADGDALAACALRNKEALGITYVIWRQRINYGNGWQAMEDRGGATANHMDHVHVSFGSSAGGPPVSC